MSSRIVDTPQRPAQWVRYPVAAGWAVFPTGFLKSKRPVVPAEFPRRWRWRSVPPVPKQASSLVLGFQLNLAKF